MHIILSTNDNYKGKLIGQDCIIRANTIGHEIHITRPILLFLLSNHLININDTIVTKNNERFFLYSEIFSNVIDYDSFINKNILEEEIIDITHLNSLIENKNDLNYKLDIEEQFPLLKDIRFNKILIQNELYKTFIKQIKFINIENIDKEFIVIHDRQTSYSISNINETINVVNNILQNFPNLNIIIFNVLNNLPISSEKIKIIHRIDEYASYMNHYNCKAVISPFSGGGQLSQFCHNVHIYYYCNGAYDFYNDYKLNIEYIYNVANEPNNIYNYFDLKKTTNSKVSVFHNANDIMHFLIENCKL
jgi:hypothetical protein